MPTRLRDLSNTDFGTLDFNKNKNIMRYNGVTGKFDIINIDNTLGLTSTPSQQFIDTIESEIDINNIGFQGLDGGEF